MTERTRKQILVNAMQAAIDDVVEKRDKYNAHSHLVLSDVLELFKDTHQSDPMYIHISNECHKIKKKTQRETRLLDESIKALYALREMYKQPYVK